MSRNRQAAVSHCDCYIKQFLLLFVFEPACGIRDIIKLPEWHFGVSACVCTFVHPSDQICPGHKFYIYGFIFKKIAIIVAVEIQVVAEELTVVERGVG